MIYNKFSRRHFLIGTGALYLSVPTLVSLLPKALASDVPNNKFFIFLSTPHGGLNEEHWAPRNFPAGTRKLINIGEKYGDVRWANLNDLVTPAGLTAMWDTFSTPLLSKMNIIEGLDIPFYLAHNEGLLGSFESPVSGDASRIFGYFNDPNDAKWTSLDYFLSKSEEFGATKHGIFNFANNNFHSFYYNASGQLTRSPTLPGDLGQVYDTLFAGVNASVEEIEGQAIVNQKKKRVIDRVLGSFNNLVAGAYGDAKRISYDDKLILQDHIQGLRDIEKKLDALGQSGLVCTKPSRSTGGYKTHWQPLWDPSTEGQKMDVIVDMILASLKCGSCRVFNLGAGNANTHVVNDFHQDIAHLHTDPSVQLKILENMRNVARDIFIKLGNKLNSSPAPQGGTILDQGLIYWTHENSRSVHNNDNQPIATLGSASGFFKTGLHVDYRQFPIRPVRAEYNFTAGKGIYYTRWLATIAQSMGVSPQSFEKGNQKGYGGFASNWKYDSASGPKAYAEQVNDLSVPLPIIT